MSALDTLEPPAALTTADYGRKVAPQTLCDSPGCERPRYIGELCKFHHDWAWYLGGMRPMDGS